MSVQSLKRRKMHTSLFRYLRSSTAVPLFMLILMVNVIAEPVKIHPIGDSTTEAFELETAWRYWLYKKLIKNGYVSIDFVGSQQGTNRGKIFSDMDWDMDHDGYTSAKSSKVFSMIKGCVPKLTPHIAVIFLGTNDIRGKRKIVDIIKIFKDIIGLLRDARKEVKIVVCQIPYWNHLRYGGSKAAVDALNAAFPSLKDLGTEISPIKIVDLNSDYKVSDHRDGIHPDTTGAVKIADRVYDAITPWLSDIKITANKRLYVFNQTHRTGVKSRLRLTIQDNMPVRIWISTESGSGVTRERGYLITGRKIY